MFDRISHFWDRIQGYLFPIIEEELGPLTEKQLQLIETLEVIQIERFIQRQDVGRPKKDRIALARAFVAKAVYNMTTTRSLIERVHTDPSMRRICGWERVGQIPEEWIFSRAFAEFAASELPQQVHSALIKRAYKDHLVGHVSRDATAIQAREKPLSKKKKEEQKPQKKRGRPKKGEERPPQELPRLEKQLNMTQKERLEDLPKPCDVGAKLNSKGHLEWWIGYKCHIDTADGDIPLSCIVTSASVHDSQVAIPLLEETSSKVQSLYDLMDSAYDCPQILQYSKGLGHVPIVDQNMRRDTEGKAERELENIARKTINWEPAEEIRYNQRSSSERVNGRLKDEFGGHMLRVRGHAKVACHLMFGILALTANALLNLIR